MAKLLHQFTICSVAIVLLSTTAVAQQWRPVGGYYQNTPPNQPVPPINGNGINNGNGEEIQSSPSRTYVDPHGGGPYLPSDGATIMAPGMPYAPHQPFDPCCEPQPWIAQPHACDSCGRQWYVMADAMWLNRSDPSHRNLSVIGDGSPTNINQNQIVMSTNDLDFDLEPGVRLTLGHFINPEVAIEGTFFGFQDWNTRATAGGPSAGLDPYWGPRLGPNLFDAFTNADLHHVNYSTRLYNAELGLRKWVRPNASVLAGIRFLTIDEDLDFFSHDPNDADTGLYSIHTDNELIGLQIGGEYMRPLILNHLRVALHGKAGVFLNFAEQDTHIDDLGLAPAHAAGEADEVELASLLEFGITFTLRLSDHISLRAGYNHIFLTGLALASDHLSNPDHVNGNSFMSTEGSLHLQGPFVGGEFVFP